MSPDQLAIRVLLTDRPHGGRCTEQGIDPILLNHTPIGRRIRGADRLTFVEHRGAAAHQWPIDDQRMTDHPAHIGNAPPHVTGVHAVDVAHGITEGDSVATVLTDDALGFARGTRGVHDVKRVCRFQLDRRHRLGIYQRLLPVKVAVWLQPGASLGPLQHQHLARLMVSQLQCAVDQRLVLDHPIEFQAAGRRQQQRWPRIIDTQGQLVGCKATEHHRVHRTDTRAGEHGHGRLRHHRHVDDHSIAFAHPQLAQQTGQARHLVTQLVVAERLLHAGHGGVVDQRRLLATAQLDLPIEGQVAAVQAAVSEPAMGAVRVFLQRQGGFAVPGQMFGLFGPEGSRVGNGMGVVVLVGHVDGNPVLVVIEGRALSMDRHARAAMGLKSQRICRFAASAKAPHNGAKPLE